MSSEASSRITSIRAADAKEVGVGNPAEETCCRPNILMLLSNISLSISYPSNPKQPQMPFPNRRFHISFRISWLYAIRFSFKVRL
jgi:hypothetical protein